MISVQTSMFTSTNHLYNNFCKYRLAHTLEKKLVSEDETGLKERMKNQSGYIKL